ncbi:MAG: glycosyltransferase, partial [Mycoplasmataceae bacterium]|nr:glycosyltransferase [Mycoplasmataceae bacterium]
FLKLDYQFKKILFITNWCLSNKEEKEIDCFLKTNLNNKYLWITLKNINNKANNDLLFKKTVTFNDYYFINENKLNSIALSRMILNYYLYENVKNKEVIWIIDDDMQFHYEIYQNEKNISIPIKLKEVVSFYYHQQYDMVIGNYTNYPPVPFLTTLRTNLIDYLYNVFYHQKVHDKNLLFLKNYYYTLDKSNRKNWEWSSNNSCKNLNELFNQKDTSRKLFEFHEEYLIENEAINRGGNSLIFNKEILKIPNASLNINDVIGRRSDFFFVLNAKVNGFKIINTNFCLSHCPRNNYIFNYEHETNKFISDLIGYSFTTAYKYLINNNIKINLTDFDLSKNTHWFNIFKNEFQTALTHRLSLFILNYFRIIGILKIIKDKTYIKDFNEDSLNNLVHKILRLINIDNLWTSTIFFKNLDIINKLNDINHYSNIIKNNLNISNNLDFIGIGYEGITFKNENWCYKYFYNNLDLEKLFNALSRLKDVAWLTKTKIYQDKNIVAHEYLNSSSINKLSNLQKLTQIIQIQNDLINNKVFIQDLKPDNFLLDENNQIKLIDFGKNIFNLRSTEYEDKLIKSLYRLYKYSNLNENDFCKLLYINYHLDNQGIYYQYENYLWLSKFHTKEDIHDEIIYDLVAHKTWNKLLDYGAGKCKIANKLVEVFQNKEIHVFDTNEQILNERKDKNIVKINLTHDNKLKEKYDIVLLNEVLCCTTKKIHKQILNNIDKLLLEKGNLICSICNPFFDDMYPTQLLNNITNYKQYDKCFCFNKQTIYGTRKELHYPFLYYQRLLNKYNFKIKQIKQDKTYAYNLNEKSEYLYFDCIKHTKNYLNDCSLLIKTNPMDHEVIMQNIIHIVNQLEQNDSFKTIIVIVDDIKHEKNRIFSNENLKKLKQKLNYLKKCLYIDKIYYASDYEHQKNEIYLRYFNQTVQSTSSLNNQQLFATLLGFSLIKTKYVFQTDCDILFFNNDKESLLNYLNKLKQNQNALSLSLSICHKNNSEIKFNERIEVRNCFINLSLLNNMLPLKNNIKNNQFELSWHKSVDLSKDHLFNLRSYSKNLYFIHPSNELKKENLNYIAYISCLLEQKHKPNKMQQDHVDLISCNMLNEYFKEIKVKNRLVIFSRGKDIAPSKILRWLNSLKKQTIQDFIVIYIDDCSNIKSKEYIKMLFTYDEWCKDHVISLFNWRQIKELPNFYFAINQIMANNNSIIINLDGDDAFLTNDAISKIKQKFDEGADVSVGNCFNTLKPTRIYQNVNFNAPWLRNGDNVWLHPKCFLLKLAKKIKIEDLKINNKFVQRCTDFAMMYPILLNAKNPVFIKDIIYLYDPANIKQDKKYNRELIKKALKNKILNKILN